MVSLIKLQINELLNEELPLSIMFNPLKTKRNVLYVTNQPVPHSKHFPPRL